MQANNEAEIEELPGLHQASGTEHQPFCGCYLLRSLHPQHPRSTYVGFTVNPLRRIRQHNGEIQGGAYKTKGRRPWTFVALVHGFATQSEALQFEWAWQHPTKSKAIREAAARLGVSTRGRKSGWRGHFEVLGIMLTDQRWQNLHIRIPDPQATPAPKALVERATITLGSVESWQPASLAAENRTARAGADTGEEDDLTDDDQDAMCCAVCGLEDMREYRTCHACGANSHSDCLALLVDEHAAGRCPLCDSRIVISLRVLSPAVDFPPARCTDDYSSFEDDDQDTIDLTTPLSNRVASRQCVGDDDDDDDDVDVTLDLCSPSPVQQGVRTPVISGLRPEQPMTISSGIDEASIIDLTRSITKSHLSSPDSLNQRHFATSP